MSRGTLVEPAPDDDNLCGLPSGTMLAEYRIHSVLGQGGFGITYRAIDTHLHEAVAIKEYFPSHSAIRLADRSAQARSKREAAAFEQGVRSFLDEARLIARFRHSNIMRVRRFFEAHGTGYMVLDFVEGRSLETALADGALPEAMVRHVLAGILAGLATVHDDAVLHRDLKPRNVILRPDDTPVLIDFGAARDFGSRDSQTVTQIVSPGYSSPEQYGIGGSQGPWSDLYSVGAILYRAVTGEVPADALRRLRSDPLVPASTAAAGRYDPRLLRLIDAMMTMEPTARPGSAAEIAAELAMPTATPAQRAAGAAAPSAFLRLTPLSVGSALLAVALVSASLTLPKAVRRWEHAQPHAQRQAAAMPDVVATASPPPAAPSVLVPDHPSPGTATTATSLQATAAGSEGEIHGATRDDADASPSPIPKPSPASTPAPPSDDAPLLLDPFEMPAAGPAPDLTPTHWRACALTDYCDARLLPSVQASGTTADLPWGERQALAMWSEAVSGEVYRLPWQAASETPTSPGLGVAMEIAGVSVPTCPSCDEVHAGPIVDPAKHIPLPLGMIDDGDQDDGLQQDADDGPVPHAEIAPHPSRVAVAVDRPARGNGHRGTAHLVGNEGLRRHARRGNPCPPVRVGRWKIFGKPSAGARASGSLAAYGGSWQTGCVYGGGR